MRKGTKVRYIGKNELMKDRVFTVHQKEHGFITIYAPIKYLDGSIHNEKCSMDINEFEVVK